MHQFHFYTAKINTDSLSFAYQSIRERNLIEKGQCKKDKWSTFFLFSSFLSDEFRNVMYNIRMLVSGTIAEYSIVGTDRLVE